VSGNIDRNHPFSVVIPVRITDINYGKHLGHTALVGIFHQARVLFLAEHNFEELNIEGFGLILTNATYSYKREAFFNTKLLIKIGIGEYSKTRFNFIYQSTDLDSGKEIAIGKEEMAFFNYDRKKSAKIPLNFLKFCEDYQVNSIS
jgi:acyl-CoA thioester hydrolase